jgi:hypothetical protein
MAGGVTDSYSINFLKKTWPWQTETLAIQAVGEIGMVDYALSLGGCRFGWLLGGICCWLCAKIGWREKSKGQQGSNGRSR